jgi:hypothetical protein
VVLAFLKRIKDSLSFITNNGFGIARKPNETAHATAHLICKRQYFLPLLQMYILKKQGGGGGKI